MGPDITIRPAQKTDAPCICELLQQIDRFHQSFDRLQIRQGEPTLMDQIKIENAIAGEENIVYVAAEGKDDVIGYVRMSIDETNGNRIFVPLRIITVHDLIVAKERRCNGIGAALMKTVDRIAHETNAQRIRLEYYAENQTARRFYETLGYRQLRHTVVYDLPDRADNHTA